MKQGVGVALLIGSVTLSSAAQLLLKMGVSACRGSGLQTDGITSLNGVVQALLHPLVMAGLVAYVASMVGWLLVLSRFDLGYAYPFVALGIVLTTLFAWALQGETVSLQRLLGVCIIVIGVVFVARS